MTKVEYGVFCEVFGKTARNLVMEFILTMRRLDFAVSDAIEDTNLSKPKVYGLIKSFEKQGFINKSRVVAGTQLYKLNNQKREVKVLIKAFNSTLHMVLDEMEEKYPQKDTVIRKASTKAIPAKRA